MPMPKSTVGQSGPARRDARPRRTPSAAHALLHAWRRTSRARAPRPPGRRRRSRASRSAASSATPTSDPVARSSTSGFGRVAHDPRAGDCDEVRGEVGSGSDGTVWRVSTSTVGPSVFARAVRQAATVSTSSAGRSTVTPGISRKRLDVLDGLVGRPVLADRDRVVGQHVDHRLPHERRQPQRGPQVVAEHEERATRRAGSRRAGSARSGARPCRTRGSRSGSVEPA